MALVGVELEMLISQPNALTTRMVIDTRCYNDGQDAKSSFAQNTAIVYYGGKEILAFRGAYFSNLHICNKICDKFS